MGRLRFGLSSAVDDPQASDRACAFVGIEHILAEGRIADLPIDEHLLDTALTWWFGKQSCCSGIDVPRIESETDRIAGIENRVEAFIHEGRKIDTVEQPHRTAAHRAP